MRREYVPALEDAFAKRLVEEVCPSVNKQVNETVRRVAREIAVEFFKNFEVEMLLRLQEKINGTVTEENTND